MTFSSGGCVWWAASVTLDTGWAGAEGLGRESIAAGHVGMLSTARGHVRMAAVILPCGSTERFRDKLQRTVS